MCTYIRVELMEMVDLVDELVVVESGRKTTPSLWLRLPGAKIHRGREVMPQMGHVLGKGIKR